MEKQVIPTYGNQKKEETVIHVVLTKTIKLQLK
jgi:hypothetical protein